MNSRVIVGLVALALLASLALPAQAQTAYGVNSAGLLFRFDVNTPATVINIGNLGFVPEGIDFRPSTSTLYAIDIGAPNSQLYTVNTSTGAATAVGASFPSIGAVGAAGYDLSAATGYGFDFNPKTVQPDGSMRIRLIGDNRVDLRLNSDTGQVAAVDGSVAYLAGDVNANVTPVAHAAAYINNIAGTAASGTTLLFDIDAAADVLARQDPPNNGTLNTVGSLGVTVDVLPGGGFDIYTDPSSVDATIGGDTGYAVLRRTATNGGAYLFYNVNLGTGQITGGALVGGGAGMDFTGGLAIGPPVPEPSSIVLGVIGLAALGGYARRCRGRRTA